MGSAKAVKFLLVSDLHYALKQYDWAAAAAANVDALVIAGDHIDIAGQLSGNVQIVVILNYLKRLAAKANVIVSSGNHDLDMRDETGERVASWMQKVRQLGVPCDGDSVRYGDTLVTICPWWDGPIAQQRVRDQFERDAAAEKRQWVWVYHAPPDASPTSWNGKRHYGDSDLVTWINQYKPDIVLCGHIHEAPFKQAGSWADRIGDTWIFNSGRQIGPSPAHIVVDTDAREAIWFSMAGAEIIALDAALSRPFQELAALPAWYSLNSPDPGQSPA